VPKGTPGRCPSCGLAVPTGAVLCLNCGYNLAKGKKLTTAVGVVEATDEIVRTPASVLSGADRVLREIQRREELEREALRQHRIVEWVLPLILLAIGPPSLVVAGFVLMKTWQDALLAAGFLAAVELVLMVPVLLISLLLAAYFGGISFGSLWSALLKAAALSLGPGAIADVVVMYVLTFGFFVGGMAVFVVYTFFLGPPMAFLFDLDFQETRITIGFVTIVRALSMALVMIVWWAIF
jgi:hypothetical protein